MSKDKIQTDEIHDWDTWCEYYEDTDNNLDDGTWYEIYMSGYGEGQRVTKQMCLRDIKRVSQYREIPQLIQELQREWEVE
jgi:hypothetical protein